MYTAGGRCVCHEEGQKNRQTTRLKNLITLVAARSRWTETHRKATATPLLHARVRAHQRRCSPEAVWGCSRPRALEDRGCEKPLSKVRFDSRIGIAGGVFLQIRENSKPKSKIQTESFTINSLMFQVNPRPTKLRCAKTSSFCHEP